MRIVTDGVVTGSIECIRNQYGRVDGYNDSLIISEMFTQRLLHAIARLLLLSLLAPA